MIKDRLLQYINFKCITKAFFEKSIYASNGYINNVKTLGSDKLEDILNKYPDLNIEWLLTGNGNMIKESNKDDMSITQVTTDYVYLLPVSAHGGSLSEFVTTVKEKDCERIISPIKDADFAITVFGDSMAPEYPNGSQILIKRINESAFIDWGRAYVLDTCNGIVVKKIFPSDDKSTKKVKCVSVNPEYPPFEVNLRDVYGMYRVMLCMAQK